MTLTDKQNEALKIAVNRYKNKEAYTCIAGYAGSGKTTLVKFIVAALNIPKERIAYIAFTGKASHVLRTKGNENAMTAHKFLYYTRRKSDGSFIYEPKLNLKKDYDLIVIDEISMLPKEMWERMLVHKIHVLCMGDPFQLPPVSKESDNQVLKNPHIFLSEIIRQAADSEIIKLSMHLREQLPLSKFKTENKEVMIIKNNQLNGSICLWADQILCGTNKSRNNVNTIIRKLKNFSEKPQVGDKVINNKNNWDILSNNENPLTNGCIGTITRLVENYIYLPSYIYPDKKIPILNVDIETEDGDIFYDLNLDNKALLFGEKSLTPQQEYRISKMKSVVAPPLDFSYGYGITVHKAQGSQWEKVLVIEENFPYEKEEHYRHLYTAITRPSEKLVIVSKE